MASWMAILVIAAKDVAQSSRDRSAFVMGLIGPLALGDPGSPVATDVAEAIARELAADVDYVSLATTSVLTVEGAEDADRVAELTSAALAQPTPIELVSVQGEGREPDAYDGRVPGPEVRFRAVEITLNRSGPGPRHRSPRRRWAPLI